MKLRIESTEKIVTLIGVPARVWEGHTESGIPVHCYVTRVAVARELDATEFERELQEHRVPSVEIAALPARMVL